MTHRKLTVWTEKGTKGLAKTSNLASFLWRRIPAARISGGGSARKLNRAAITFRHCKKWTTLCGFWGERKQSIKRTSRIECVLGTKCPLKTTYKVHSRLISQILSNFLCQLFKTIFFFLQDIHFCFFLLSSYFYSNNRKRNFIQGSIYKKKCLNHLKVC